MCRLWRWIFWFYWSIYIQGSLFCWFYVLITNACFYVHLYIGMFLSFVKQQLRTVKFLDLRALRSFFMQVQYKRKILFHCYILVKSGQTPYNRSVTEKDILTSLPISCNCLPCWVCAFCKDLYIKLIELLYNSHACKQDLLKHSKACMFYNQNGMWSFSKARFNKGAMIICKMCMDVRGDFYLTKSSLDALQNFVMLITRACFMTAKRAFNTSCDCEHLNLWLLHPYTLSWALTSELLSDAVILMEKTKERSAKILSTVYYAFSETQCYKWSLLLILLKYVDQDWRCSILKFMYTLTVGFYVNKVLGICALFNCSFFLIQEILQ